MRKIFVLVCLVGLWALPAQAENFPAHNLSPAYSQPPSLKRIWDFKTPPLLHTLCGNGVVELGEECDDGNSDQHDACTNTCRSARCGDGVLQLSSETAPSEECDDGSVCSDGSVCKTDADCGDGVCMPQSGDGCGNAAGEECDDGNTVDDDGCSSLCKLAFCGDGIVQTVLGEECDGGAGCSTDCRRRYIPIKPFKGYKPRPWNG